MGNFRQIFSIENWHIILQHVTVLPAELSMLSNKLQEAAIRIPSQIDRIRLRPFRKKT